MLTGTKYEWISDQSAQTKFCFCPLRRLHLRQTCDVFFKCSGASSTSSSYLQVRVSSRSSANPTSLKVWFGCCQAVEDPVKIALLSSRCLKTACFVWPAVHKAERPRGVTDNTIKSRPRIADTRRPIGKSRPQIHFILAAPPPKATKNSVLHFCSVMSWGTEMKNQHLRHIVFWSSNSWIHLIRSNTMVANYWTEGLMTLMQLSVFLLFLSVCGDVFFCALNVRQTCASHDTEECQDAVN